MMVTTHVLSRPTESCRSWGDSTWYLADKKEVEERDGECQQWVSGWSSLVLGLCRAGAWEGPLKEPAGPSGGGNRSKGRQPLHFSRTLGTVVGVVWCLCEGLKPCASRKANEGFRLYLS